MIANILLYHLLLDHTGAAVAIIVAILWRILVFRYRQYFSPAKPVALPVIDNTLDIIRILHSPSLMNL